MSGGGSGRESLDRKLQPTGSTMTDSSSEPRTVLIHFYRAVVGHADVWRQRMDSTTNWAAATTAGMLTFTFGSVAAPHFVLLLAVVFNGVFLLIEARRYQAYDRWRRQFHALNQYLIAPYLVPGEGPDDRPGRAAVREAMIRVREDLGRTVPHLSLREAVGYRIRRNYGYLFAIVLMGWILKLQAHPEPAAGLDDIWERMSIAGLSPALVLMAVLLGTTVGIVLAVTAPTERMMDWTEVGAPWRRWRIPRWLGGGSDAGSGHEPVQEPPPEPIRPEDARPEEGR